MTEPEALDRLLLLIQASAEPVLTADEQAALLDISRREDSEGRAPSDADWEPTFDLDAGAAEGWRWKAGKVAGRFSVNIDGDSLSRAQVFSHCLSMADKYANRLVGSLGVRTSHPPADDENDS